MNYVKAHGVDLRAKPPAGHIYVSCEVCGERALLPEDYMTHNRSGKRVTIRELLQIETLGSCGPWRCPRHPTKARFA